MGFDVKTKAGATVRVSLYTKRNGDILLVDKSGNLYDQDPHGNWGAVSLGQVAPEGAAAYDSSGDSGSTGGGETIANVVLGSAGASFSSPALDLSGWLLVRVIAQLRAGAAGEGAGAWIRAMMRFNGDAGANYIWGVQQADGTFTKNGDAGFANGIEGLWGSGTNFSSSYWGTNIYELVLPGAAGAYKSVSYQGGIPSGTNLRSAFGAGYWNNVAAITQITFASNDGSNIAAGSKFTVVGMARDG